MRRALGTPQTSEVGLRGRSFDAAGKAKLKRMASAYRPVKLWQREAMKGLLFDESRSGEESFPIFQVES